MMDDIREHEDKLKAVFSLCDPQGNGFITVDRFLDLAKEHFGADEPEAEELSDLVKVLDPQNNCKISFEDFLKGVQRIVSVHGGSSDVGSVGRTRHGSEETLIDQPLGSQETLLADDDAGLDSHSTYSEYDMLTDDDNNIEFTSSNRKFGLPVVIRPHSDDECDSAISGPYSRHDQSSITDGEERFEGYGEDEISSEASDIPSFSCDDSRLKSPHNSESQVKRRRDRQIPTRPRRISCNLTSWRSSPALPTVGKIARLSTASTASRPPAHPNSKSNLFRPSSSNTSRRSSLSDEIFDDIDVNFLHLNDKVRQLEYQLTGLSKTQVKSDDRHGKLKEENLYLEDRVHILEENLRDMQTISRENIQMEQKKHKEYAEKQDRLLNGEIENLTTRLHSVEREYIGLKEEAPRLQAELEILRREKRELEEKLSETVFNYKSLSVQHEELEDKFKQQATDFERERQLNAELLDELGKELDDLRRFKMEGSGRSRSASVTSVYKDLESEINKYRQENTVLREQNEELHGTIIQTHVHEGRTLLHVDTAAKSLAQELDDMSRDEIMEALVEQREVNFKLREYIDRIILTIVERNPSLLEISNSDAILGKKS